MPWQKFVENVWMRELCRNSLLLAELNVVILSVIARNRMMKIVRALTVHYGKNIMEKNSDVVVRMRQAYPTG